MSFHRTLGCGDGRRERRGCHILNGPEPQHSLGRDTSCGSCSLRPLVPECSPCQTGTWRSGDTHAVEAPAPWLQVLGSPTSCLQPGTCRPTSMSGERWRQHAGLPQNHPPPHVSGRLISAALDGPLPADCDVLVGVQAPPPWGGALAGAVHGKRPHATGTRTPQAPTLVP